MKPIYKFVAVLAGALLTLSACGPSLEDTVLELTDADVPVGLYTHEQQQGFVLINCNRSWTATSSERWLELETKKGSSDLGEPVKFSLSRNETKQYREGTITIKAGKASLDFVVRQMPEILYYVNENFGSSSLVLEADLPSGWYGDGGSALDVDGDGYGWRCMRDENTDETFAYSASYDSNRGRALKPDNWMTTPRFTLADTGYSLRWDVKGSDPDFLGDKYEVYIAAYQDGYALELVEKICDEVTTSADVLTSHEINLDKYVGERICIAFHHYDSYNLSRVLITNVEVSNR